MNTGEAIVSLGVRAGGGEGDGHRRRREHGLAAAGGGAGQRGPRRRDDVARDGVTSSSTSREPVVAKGKAEPVPVWVALRAQPASGRRRQLSAAPPRRPGATRRSILLDALARVESEREPAAGHARRRARDRQEPARLRALRRGRRAARAPTLARRAAACPMATGSRFWALARSSRPRPASSTPTRAEAARRSSRAVGVRSCPADQAEWVDGLPAPARRARRRQARRGERRTEAFAAWRRFLEGWPSSTRSSSSSRTCTGRTTACSTSSTTSSTGRRGVPMLVLCDGAPRAARRGLGLGRRAAERPDARRCRRSRDAEVARLLALLLDQSMLAAETEARLLERAGGNPLYAEQFARLFRERGDARRAAPPGDRPGLIAARLDALTPAEEKSLLQDAAVMGKVFWTGCLLRGGDLRWPPSLCRGSCGRSSSAASGAPRSRARTSSRSATSWSATWRTPRSPGPTGRTSTACGRLDRALGGAVRRTSRDPRLPFRRRARSPARPVRDLRSSRTAPALRSATRACGRSRSTRASGRCAVRQQALEPWPDDDPEWAYVALRQGRVEHDVRQAGAELPLVARAFELFLERGDADRAADAEVLLAERDWFAGRSDSTFARLEHARSLVDGRPTSASKARDVRRAVAVPHARRSLRGGCRRRSRRLALAREVGMRELQAHVLINIGTARAGVGDLGGYADLEEAFSIAEPINSLEALRAQGNHGVGPGRLRRSPSCEGPDRVEHGSGRADGNPWLHDVGRHGARAARLPRRSLGRCDTCRHDVSRGAGHSALPRADRTTHRCRGADGARRDGACACRIGARARVRAGR